MYRKLLAFAAAGLIMSSLAALAMPEPLRAASSSGDIIVQTIPGPTVAQQLKDRTSTSWAWYITRGSGMVAAIALLLLMLSGIGQITGTTFRFLEPLTAWASHRALGIAFGVMVLIHMFALLFDRFVPFTLAQLLVPWLSPYKPLTIFGIHFGSLFIALGVLAFYGVALVVITSLFWVEKRPYLWKFLHLSSYILLLFVFIHALFLGTDLVHGWLRAIWVVGGAGLGLAILIRLRRAYTL